MAGAGAATLADACAAATVMAGADTGTAGDAANAGGGGVGVAGLVMEATAAFDAAASLDAAAILLRSCRFFASSAARSAAALALLACASWSSVDLPVTTPLDKVSLSGVVAPGFLSSTLACNLPLTSRLEGVTCVTGARPASLRRNSLKSLLCATMIWRASAGAVALAWASVGSMTIAPAFMRFTLSPMKASGLVRSMATSI